MEVQTHVCDDELSLLERNESPTMAKRVLPGFCAVALLAAAGAGGRIAWTSTGVGDVVSLSTACSFDGDDCRSTGCCAQAGSTCFRKNHHWASCNETCTPNKRWSHHQWTYTTERVWDCSILARQAPTVPQAAPVQVQAAPVQVQAAPVQVQAAPVQVQAAPVQVPAAPVQVQPAPVQAQTAPLFDDIEDAPTPEFDDIEDAPTPEVEPDDAELAPSPGVVAPVAPVPAPVIASASVPVAPVATQPAGPIAAPVAAAATPAGVHPDPSWAVQHDHSWAGHHDSSWALDSYKASVYEGCPEDGHDCRAARCCARRGSRCFVKNHHWASCNETCMPFTQWEGSHGHGSWKHTTHPVWDCADITTADNQHATLR